MYISNGINEIVLSSRIKLQLTNDFISVNKPMLDCISDIADHFNVYYTYLHYTDQYNIVKGRYLPTMFI
jgi:hypothetical protein